MRTIRSLDHALAFDARALRGEQRWLYRSAADRGMAVLGVGCTDLLEVHDPDTAFARWRRFLQQGRPSMGFLTYALREPLFGQRSRHPQRTDQPLLRWFVPEVMVCWEKGRTHFLASDPKAVDRLIDRLSAPQEELRPEPWNGWELTTGMEAYLSHAGHLLDHIQRGDIYEVNLCVERRASLPGRDPHTAFMAGLRRTQAAFAAFHAWDQRYILCFSPERFLWTGGGRVHCEPMKGTRPRAADPDTDRALAAELARDPKERAENIMATDVVRHDLSRVAAEGSVVVPELCGVRSRGAVHQMVSRVEARLADDLLPADAVVAAFPMASMTGAPKYRAMDLIDRQEDQPRGLFSGTIGWCDARCDLDLNVVIRTVEYDARTGDARLVTGSALTAACDLHREWAECALKADSVIQALGDAAP